jgi:hypothetical protein
MRRFCTLTAALCAVVLLCGFSTVAYAGGGDEGQYTGGYEETAPAPEPEPTIQPGEGFSEDGNLVIRDLLYDGHTNKQFITVQTKGGSTFYIVIDYDKPTDEDSEQYEAFFLNTVDEADLLAVIEAAGTELPACSCADRCAAGTVNTACSVCAVNMAECAGAEAQPEPEDTPDPADEPEPEKGGGGMLILAVAVVLLAGGVGYYFKVYRAKKLAAGDCGEYEDVEPEDSAEWLDGGDGYDDGPPWDEDEGESEDGE